jgi:hypothetical protein
MRRQSREIRGERKRKKKEEISFHAKRRETLWFFLAPQPKRVARKKLFDAASAVTPICFFHAHGKEMRHAQISYIGTPIRLVAEMQNPNQPACMPRNQELAS